MEWLTRPDGGGTEANIICSDSEAPADVLSYEQECTRCVPLNPLNPLQPTPNTDMFSA